MRMIHDWLRGHDAKQYDNCHAINTRVLIYNANKAVNPYGGVVVLLSKFLAKRLFDCETCVSAETPAQLGFGRMIFVALSCS